MPRFKSMFAALAATGMVLAQPAAAAARTGAPVNDSEAIEPGAGMIVGLLGLLGLVFVIMAISDGEDRDTPHSP